MFDFTPIKQAFFTIFLVLFSCFVLVTPARAQEKVYTSAELSQFDGRDGRSAYFAYEGQVYDVTGSPLWKLGEHFGLQAGEDLTGKLENAPHGTEVFASFPVVGQYEGEIVGETPTTTQEEAPSDLPIMKQGENPAAEAMMIEPPLPEKKWYEGRIRILGISILGWTGIVMGIFFVLTFATCFAMPWAKLPLPWKGSRLGPDPLDDAPKHMIWSSIHKHFVWWVVILGVIHGVLGVLQMLGWYL